MSNKNYDELASTILELVGGKENVASLAHCVTRLRFDVKDKTEVDENKLQNLKGIHGCRWSGEQLQVIVGSEINEVYDAVCKIGDFEKTSQIQENLDAGKKFNFRTLLDKIIGSLVPTIPVLCAVGMIKVVLTLCSQFGWIDPSNSTYTVLNFCADAGLYFMPVFVGGFAAKQFNCNTAIGMLIGAMLVHPTYVDFYNTGASVSVFGLPITLAAYGNSVFPSIIGVFVYSFVEKFFDRVCPKAVRSILAPTLSVLVMIPLMFVVIGPLGTILGNYVTAAFMAIYNLFGFIGLGIIAGLMPLVVFTGMHYPLAFGALDLFIATGKDLFCIPATIISNFDQAIAGFAVALKNKNADDRAYAIGCSMPALAAGITEPVMYGVTFKYKTPLLAAMIGSFLGGMVAGLGRPESYVFGGSSLFALFGFLSDNMANFWWEIAGVLVGGVATFILTLILYKPENNGVEE